MFIADLHLQTSEPETLALARHFLTHTAPGAKKLFILGDLVEYWVGDDAYDGALDSVLEPLASLAGLGTTTYLMHGNRDFLMGEQFAQLVNAELIRSDHYVLSTPDTKLLLMHGDTLCLDDAEYQHLRKMLRDPTWQREFLAQSVEQRHDYAASLREESHQQSAAKSRAIMDVTDDAVADILRKFNATTLVHGHTHRPARHELSVDGKRSVRWVLGDWHPNNAVYGVLENGDLTLKTLTDASFRSSGISK